MYVSMVRPRWSDMDAFGHVNHARLVTLLEEARVPLIFDEAGKAGLTEFAKGMVVVELSVRYRAPIVVRGQDLRVDVTMPELRHASATLAYQVHSGPSGGDPVAVVADTVLAPYDVGALRPRRFSGEEREFLRANLSGSADD